MTLEEYKKRRDFGKTLEPAGKSEKEREETGRSPEAARAPRGGEGKIFVIQEHHATRLHWDFRLEMEGVLKSWAVPKEPPQIEGVKRLAVQTEDHPLEYAQFEGKIPEGQYGAGVVKVWDQGAFIPEKISEKEIIFELKGKKMQGSFALIRLKPNPKFKGKNNWLFFKKKG